MSDATHGYIARRSCGCIVGAAVDIPRNGAEIGRWVKDGLALERKTVAEVRAALSEPTAMRCPHLRSDSLLVTPASVRVVQPTLFDPQGRKVQKS